MNSIIVLSVFVVFVICMSIFATYMDKRNEEHDAVSE